MRFSKALTMPRIPTFSLVVGTAIPAIIAIIAVAHEYDVIREATAHLKTVADNAALIQQSVLTECAQHPLKRRECFDAQGFVLAKERASFETLLTRLSGPKTSYPARLSGPVQFDASALSLRFAVTAGTVCSYGALLFPHKCAPIVRHAAVQGRPAPLVLSGTQGLIIDSEAPAPSTPILAITGGTAPYTLAADSDDVTISATGALTGITLPVGATRTVRFSVTDAEGSVAHHLVAIKRPDHLEAPDIEIAVEPSADFPADVIHGLTARGGIPPYSFSCRSADPVVCDPDTGAATITIATFSALPMVAAYEVRDRRGRVSQATLRIIPSISPQDTESTHVRPLE